MKSPETPLALGDQIGCMWLLSLMFLSGGVIVLLFGLGVVGNGQPRGWPLVAVLALGATHTAAGAWLLSRSPLIRVKLVDQELRLTQRWPFFKTARRSIHLSEIRRIVTRRGSDSDGDPTWWLELELITGEKIRLTSMEHRSPERIERAVADLKAWSGHRLPHRFDGSPTEGPD